MTGHMSADRETGRHHRNGHLLELAETDWRCLICGHYFDAAADADRFACGDSCAGKHPGEQGAAATERLMLALLRQRYTRVSMGAHRYAFAEHVPNRPGFAQRIADFMAIDCYGAGPWEARRHEIHGHEIKVSRSDWLAELRDPEKAEAFRPYCHRWWLVVADHSIVRPGELPEGWGLLARAGGVLRATKAAPLLTPEPMPPGLFASMLRATAKTAAATLVREAS